MICDDAQLNLTRTVDEIVRLREERARLRLLLAYGLGIAEGCGLTGHGIKEFIEKATKEIGCHE